MLALRAPCFGWYPWELGAFSRVRHLVPRLFLLFPLPEFNYSDVILSNVLPSSPPTTPSNRRSPSACSLGLHQVFLPDLAHTPTCCVHSLAGYPCLAAPRPCMSCGSIFPAPFQPCAHRHPRPQAHRCRGPQICLCGTAPALPAL